VDVTERCLALAGEASAELYGPNRAAWLARLTGARDDFRAALGVLAERGDAARGLRLAVDLRELWLSGPIDEGREWIGRFLAMPHPAGGGGRRGRKAAGASSGRAAVSEALRAGALDVAGSLALYADDVAGAVAPLEEALALRRRLGDDGAVAQSLVHFGSVQWAARGDVAGAVASFEEALGLYRRAGDAEGVAVARLNLAQARLRGGEHAAAAPLVCASIRAFRVAGATVSLYFALGCAAAAAAGLGRPAEALGMAGAAAALLPTLGLREPPSWPRFVGEWLEPAVGALTAAEREAALAEGRALGPERALDLALGLEPPVEIATARLVVRDFVAADLTDVQALRGDPEVARFMEFAPESAEQARDWLDGVIGHNRRRPREAHNLAVVERASGRAIGWIGTGRSSRRADAGEYGVGYMLASGQWGRGLMAEALRAVLAFTFESLGARRVSAWCWAENAASVRVMAKAGMTFARSYERTEPKSGQARAVVEYAIRVEEM
jgi:ribosomal-protein-alanine N-acetyltransferase